MYGTSLKDFVPDRVKAQVDGKFYYENVVRKMDAVFAHTSSEYSKTPHKYEQNRRISLGRIQYHFGDFAYSSPKMINKNPKNGIE